jgi:hypothetical protein
MKKGLIVFILICFFIHVKGFCQVVSTCGIAVWYASVRYTKLSVVARKGTIYKNPQWFSGAVSGRGGWTSLGACNEQFIILGSLTNIRFACVNSAGSISVINTAVKEAVSLPPS